MPIEPRRGFLVLAAILVALLFVLGAQPFAVGLFPAPSDKLAHFVVFGALSGLLYRGARGDAPWRIVALVGIVGALDEWHQIALPGRSAGIDDLVTDIAAAVCVVAIAEYRRAQRFAAAARPRGC